MRITRFAQVAAVGALVLAAAVTPRPGQAAPAAHTGTAQADPPWQLGPARWSEPTRLATTGLGFTGLQVSPDGYATTAFRVGGTDEAPAWAAYERPREGEWTQVAGSTVAEQTEFSDAGEGWRRWAVVEDGEPRWRVQHRPVGGSFESGSELVPPHFVPSGDTWLRDDFILARGRSAPAVMSVSAMPGGGYRTGVAFRDPDGAWNFGSGSRTTEGDPAFHAAFHALDSSEPVRAAWVRSAGTGQELVTSAMDGALDWASDKVNPIITPAPVAGGVSWAGDSTVLLWMDAAHTRVAAATPAANGRPGLVTDLGTVLVGTGGVHTVTSERPGQDSLVWVTNDHRLRRATVRAGEAPVVTEIATGVSDADVAADSRGNVLIAWSSTADDHVHYLLDWVGAGQSPQLVVPTVDVHGGDLALGTLDDRTFTLMTDNGYASDLAIPVSVTRVRALAGTRWLPRTTFAYRATPSWTIGDSYDVRARSPSPRCRASG